MSRRKCVNPRCANWCLDDPMSGFCHVCRFAAAIAGVSALAVFVVGHILAALAGLG